jgi:internalin A
MTPKAQAAYEEAQEQIARRRELQGRLLNLNGLGLTRLPSEIGQLSALTRLFLHDNQLTSLPPEIGQLSALTVLYLDANQLTSLPPEICQLYELTGLQLNFNQLNSLPPEIGQLYELKELYLNDNHLTSLPPEIGRLSALTKLYLNDNHLTSLPPEIGRLSALKELYLNDNQLTSLPPEISRLKHLSALFLHGNPGLGIPDSVLGPTVGEVYAYEKKNQKPPARPGDILNFYFAQRAAKATGAQQAVGEIKVMLVGRGGAGKTSLRRFFLNQPHDVREAETQGIALEDFEMECGGKQVLARLWDFAGQEITHALHQFFLTEGCVYVLVLDPRSNTEMRDALYWLALLKRYAAGAPVVVALNRQDARKGGYDVDRRLLKERFPSIQGFLPTNCETRDGCEELRAALCGAISTVPTTQPPHLEVPKSWLAVKDECFKEGRGKSTEKKGAFSRLLKLAGYDEAKLQTRRQHLRLEEFRVICAKHGEIDAAKQESLARLLHQLGAVLHFSEDPRLRDTAVLNPHWVTHSVYRLLRCKEGPHSDGIMTLADAQRALPHEEVETVRYLLRMMERFEMCFPVDGEDGQMPTRWLVAGALREFQPEGVGLEWQQPGAVKMRYVYDPLPEGVIPRFIVRTHLLSEGQPRWRSGVILRDGAAAALIRRSENVNMVEVVAFGPEEERLRLLEVVQGNLERINADVPEPSPYAELELAGLPGIYRPVADLEAAEAGKQQVAVKTPAGDALVQPTPQLNRASEQAARDPARQPLSLFLSYSHKDKREKMQFQENLTVMNKKRLITPWQDGLIEPGTLWLEQITTQLEQMDVFVGLLTNAFIASDFIEKVEVKAARERLQVKGRDFLFVLILVDDIPLEGLDIAAFQILKPGGKAVSQHPSRKIGFTQAQRELEEFIRKRMKEKLAEEPERHPSRERAESEVRPTPPGITMIVQGDYIAGHKTMIKDDHSIHAHDISNSQVGQTLTNCTNMIQQQAPGELKTLLTKLEQEVTELLSRLPEEKQEETAGNLELVTKALTGAKPNRAWYSVSSEGLLEAVKAVKDFSGDIAGTLGNLTKLVGL